MYLLRLLFFELGIVHLGREFFNSAIYLHEHRLNKTISDINYMNPSSVVYRVSDHVKELFAWCLTSRHYINRSNVVYRIGDNVSELFA